MTTQDSPSLSDADARLAALEAKLRKAEEKLGQQQEHLRLLAESANICFWDWDLDRDSLLSIEALNLPPGARDIVKQSSSKDMFDLVHADDRANMREALRRYLKGECQELKCEFRLAQAQTLAQAGAPEIWLRCQGKGLFDDSGWAHRIVGIAQDITEERRHKTALAPGEIDQRVRERTGALQKEIHDRQRAERELRTSQQRLLDIAESASDWFWETDSQLRFTYISGRFFELTGGAAAHFIGRTRLEVTSSDLEALQSQPWRQHIDDLENHRAFSNFTYELTLADDRKTYVSVAGKPRFNEAGKFLGYRGAGRDITSERRAQQMIEQRERELQKILDSSPGGVAITTIDKGCVVYANDQFGKIFGRPPESLRDSKAQEYWEDIEERRRFVETFRKEGRVATKPTICRRTDGARFWCNVAWQKIIYHGEPHVLSWIYDIDELKRAEEIQSAINIQLAHEIEERQAAQQALRQTNQELEKRVKERTRQLTREKEQVELANRSKTQFLNNMSHELRTPLNAIMGLSEIMRDEILGPMNNRTYRDYAGDIHNSGHFLLELINDVLDVAKVEAGALRLDEETCRLGEEVESCFFMVREQAAVTGVALHQELPENLPDLYADKRRLKQIIINLLTNAIKFTPEQGSVIFRAAENSRGQLAIDVIDTGIGIAEEDLKTIFFPFTKVEDSLTRQHDGAGLGLPIVKSLLEQHGGELHISSQLSLGTTVTALFPKSRVRRPG